MRWVEKFVGGKRRLEGERGVTPDEEMGVTLAVMKGVVFAGTKGVPMVVMRRVALPAILAAVKGMKKMTMLVRKTAEMSLFHNTWT